MNLLNKFQVVEHFHQVGIMAITLQFLIRRVLQVGPTNHSPAMHRQVWPSQSQAAART